MKKPPTKVANKRSRPFFFSTANQPKSSPNPAQISIPVPEKSPTAGLLYNDFASFEDNRFIPS